MQHRFRDCNGWIHQTLRFLGLFLTVPQIGTDLADDPQGTRSTGSAEGRVSTIRFARPDLHARLRTLPEDALQTDRRLSQLSLGVTSRERRVNQNGWIFS